MLPFLCKFKNHSYEIIKLLRNPNNPWKTSLILIPLTRSIANWSGHSQKSSGGLQMLPLPLETTRWIQVVPLEPPGIIPGGSRWFQVFPGDSDFCGARIWFATGGKLFSNVVDSSFGFVFCLSAPFGGEQFHSEKWKSDLLRFFLAITRGEEKIVLEQKSAYSLNSGKSPSQPAPQLAQIFSGTGAHFSPPSFYFFAKGSTLFCPLKVFHTSKVHICFANFCLLKWKVWDRFCLFKCSKVCQVNVWSPWCEPSRVDEYPVNSELCKVLSEWLRFCTYKNLNWATARIGFCFVFLLVSLAWPSQHRVQPLAPSIVILIILVVVVILLFIIVIIFIIVVVIVILNIIIMIMTVSSCRENPICPATKVAGYEMLNRVLST